MQFSSLLGHVQEVLSVIRNSAKPADSLIDSFFRSRKYLGSHDRRFIAETTYGTLRHLRYCEFLVDRTFTDLKIGQDRQLLTIVAYLIGVEKKGDVPPGAIIERVADERLKERLGDLLELLKKDGDILPADPVDRMAIGYSLPTWMIQRFLVQFPQQVVEQLCRSMNEPAPLTLRVNTLKTTVADCQAALSKVGIQTVPTKLSPFGLQVAKRMNIFSVQAFRDGWFELQDEGSQLLPLIVDPKPTAKVLDACAGAGGKTLEFAALMKNRGEIFATDINGYRLEELKKRTRRAGAFNVRVLELDSLDDLFEKYRGYFDVVFIDAPCSGVGTLRRNPGLKWMVTEDTVKELTEKQVSILHSSAHLVRSGGELVYATCSVFDDENENVVQTFLGAHPEFKQLGTTPRGNDLGPELKSLPVKLFPHVHGTDGFFCSILVKT
ncbi:MAG: methyltransferase domain-containing protein, partial [Bacteroidota bacterium]